MANRRVAVSESDRYLESPSPRDKGYTKSPLDPGYQTPARNDDRPVAGDAPSPNTVAPPSPVRTVAPLPAPSSADPTATPIDPLDVRSTAPAIPALSSMKAPPPPMIERNNKGRPVSIVGGDDPVANNMALIRSQEAYKAPRSTKDQILSLLTGGIPSAIDYATNQNTRNRWATGQDITDEEGQIQRELGVQGKEASVAAAKYRPVYQQGQLENAQARIDQGQQRVDQGQQRTDQGQQRIDQGDRRLDQGDTRLDRDAPIEVNIDGQTFKVPPQVAARITAQSSEGKKSRGAAMARTKVIAGAVASRQQKQIDLEIAKMGDPQEMYATASDLWQQGVDKENQAKSMAVRTTADAETKKQLLADAAKLKETTVRIQQEAGKARSAGRGVRSALKGRTMSQQNFDRYKKDHGEAAAQELINGGVVIRN